MSELVRGMVIDVNLEPTQGAEKGKTRPCIIVTNDTYNQRVPVIQVVPITEWSDKKSQVKTNIELLPTPANGLTNKSIADCLQTRPIDYRYRLVQVRGKIDAADMQQVDQALKIVFDLK